MDFQSSVTLRWLRQGGSIQEQTIASTIPITSVLATNSLPFKSRIRDIHSISPQMEIPGMTQA